MSGSSSKYIGVCFDKKRNKWISQIVYDGNNYFLLDSKMKLMQQKQETLQPKNILANMGI